MHVTVVIAAYNEAKVIGDVVKDLQKHGYTDIVIVDDGSKDETGARAEKAGATVLRHIINRGQGAALRTGMQYALTHGADIIVTFDADGQHQAKDIKLLITPIIEGKTQAVLGSRFLENATTEMPWHRRLLLKGSILVQYLFYGIKLSDAHSGLRALHHDAAAKINLRSDRMAHSHEFAEQIHRNRISYMEVPIHVRYTEYALRKGHGSYKTAFRILIDMIKDKIVR